jgi:hypothetical protein
LPKIFFDQYNQVKNIELGFLEYKIATYAKIFGLVRFEKDFGERWITPINAYKKEIPHSYIDNELSKPEWRRLFHPVFTIY